MGATVSAAAPVCKYRIPSCWVALITSDCRAQWKVGGKPKKVYDKQAKGYTFELEAAAKLQVQAGTGRRAQGGGHRA